MKPADASVAPYAVVVNDDPTQLQVLSGLLRVMELQPQAFTGAEAALAALAATAGELPELIITDLHMPGLDGWRFCRLLRSPEYKALNQIPILVVSATFTGDEPDRIAADLGAEAFLAAPVDGSRFVAQVQAIRQGQRLRNPLRVLIVEDSRTLAGILRKAMEAQGYTVDTALSARAATAAFSAAAYDVAVFDYHLPDGSGSSLLDMFREQRPDGVCIMMTSDPGPELALDWMKRGAAAYLRKPFEPDYLIELCAKARRERALLRVQDLLEMRTRELRASNERFRNAMEATHDGVWDWDVPSGRVYYSPAYLGMLGYAPDDKPGTLDTWLNLVHPAERAPVLVAYQACVRNETPAVDVEFRMLAKDGAWRWIQARGRAVRRDAAGLALQMIGTHMDITERKQTEAAIQNSERRAHRQRQAMARLAIDAAIAAGDVPAALQRLTAAAAVALQVERASVWLLADEQQTLRCMDLFECVAQKHSDGMILKCADYPRYFEAIRAESRIYAGDAQTDPRTSEFTPGYLIPLGITAMLDAGIQSDGRLAGVVCFEHTGEKRSWHLDEEAFASTIASLVTETLANARRQQAAATIQQSLREKDALLKEIHHRVKNNLQIISSLLRLKAGQIDSPEARLVLKDMQHRVRSMALIHEHLYRSENLAQVNLATYLQSLCHQLQRALIAHPGAVQLHLDMAPVNLSIDQAIPCGLLASELVSNAFKHAFPEGREGELWVQLQPVAGGREWRLRVADNGIGLPPDFALGQLKSLGLQLVPDLATQMGGCLEVGPGPGASFTVTFTP